MDSIVIDFDPDWDHPMESVIRWHHDRAMPTTVKDFELETEEGKSLARVTGNYLARREVKLPVSISTRGLRLRLSGVNGAYPAAVFGVAVFGRK